MKNLLLFLAVVGLMACSRPVNAEVNAEETVQSAVYDTASLVQRVIDIYDVALGQYNETESNAPAPNVDSVYCSQDWYTWLTRVRDFDERNDDMGFFDADYWIMGQDWQDLSVSDVHVTAMNESSATVELNLHNCGNVIPVRLEMVNEGGEWKIDNFIDLANDVNWKAGMKEYMKNVH